MIRRHRRKFRTIPIPIVDGARRIVGWTDRAPAPGPAGLAHAEAEAVLGTRISAVYVELHDPIAARRAGAPEAWNQPWRCLAICEADAAHNGPDAIVVASAGPPG